MRSAYLRSVVAVALCSATIAPAMAEKVLGPVSGEVKFISHSADLGVGYTWGKGVLIYDGKQYPFEVSGASAAAVGFSSGNSVGKVYNLQRLEDFPGTYWSLSGETTVGKGVAGHLMENDSGVRIRLDEIRTGGRLAASPSRLTIRFLPEAKKTTTNSALAQKN